MKRNDRIVVMVTPAEKRLIVADAKRRGLTNSTWAYSLIRDQLDKIRRSKRRK